MWKTVNALSNNDQALRDAIKDTRTAVTQIVKVQDQRFENVSKVLHKTTALFNLGLKRADEFRAVVAKRVNADELQMLARHTWTLQVIDTLFRVQTMMNEIYS
jgi:hypothetical protein